MKLITINNSFSIRMPRQRVYSGYVYLFLVGLLAPLGFAPFHMPGLCIFSLALLYISLIQINPKQSFWHGFTYGLGYFSFGVSWVIISMHDYGNLNYFLAGIATLGFIIYLSLFPALVCGCFKLLDKKQNIYLKMLLFSSLWCLSELLRAGLFTGFPWLIIGASQVDTPLKYLFPIIGLHGVSLCAVFASTLLAAAITEKTLRRYFYAGLFALGLISPSLMKNLPWTEIKKEPISVGIVQANLAMRDKWDEALFWNLLDYYAKTIKGLLGTQLIILPESAIPLPASYLEEYLKELDAKALKAKSSLILGILQAADNDETHYHNSIISLGEASGEHIKSHLVPFGEYIPKPFRSINRLLQLPEPNVLPATKDLPPIEIANHPIASLICYEIAYPQLLRRQMPLGQWITSISDNGWFGHSLASYQQLQMGQVLALLTGRFHIVVNNDGLSSIINEKGNIVDGLPPFSAGILQSHIFPALGTTPWIVWGDYPALLFCAGLLLFMLFSTLPMFTKQ